MAKKKVKKTAQKTVKKKVAKSVAPVKKKKRSMGLAIIALILNIFLFPGLGTLIFGGRVRTGIWQIVIAIVGALLWGMFLGFPIFAIAWIWGLVTGIQLIQAAR
ncbi:MAG: hypothetical protein ABH864_03850 [archaeon]